MLILGNFSIEFFSPGVQFNHLVLIISYLYLFNFQFFFKQNSFYNSTSPKLENQQYPLFLMCLEYCACYSEYIDKNQRKILFYVQVDISITFFSNSFFIYYFYNTIFPRLKNVNPDGEFGFLLKKSWDIGQQTRLMRKQVL